MVSVWVSSWTETILVTSIRFTTKRTWLALHPSLVMSCHFPLYPVVLSWTLLLSLAIEVLAKAITGKQVGHVGRIWTMTRCNADFLTASLEDVHVKPPWQCLHLRLCTWLHAISCNLFKAKQWRTSKELQNLLTLSHSCEMVQAYAGCRQALQTLLRAPAKAYGKAQGKANNEKQVKRGLSWSDLSDCPLHLSAISTKKGETSTRTKVVSWLPEKIQAQDARTKAEAPQETNEEELRTRNRKVEQLAMKIHEIWWNELHSFFAFVQCFSLYLIVVPLMGR